MLWLPLRVFDMFLAVPWNKYHATWILAPWWYTTVPWCCHQTHDSKLARYICSVSCWDSRNLEAAEFRSSAELWVAEVPELSDSLLESSSTHTWAGEHTLTHTPSAPQLWLSSSIPSSGSSSISSITDTTLTGHVGSNLLQLIDDPRIFTISLSLLFILLSIRSEMRHGLPLYGGCVKTSVRMSK